jgi:serine/threonine-protein kinase
VSSLQPGDVISGRYRLKRVMGAGAMGVVWSARNESTERDFAIKLMLPEAAKDPQRLQRFFKEAKLAGRLRHRCIVEVYDLGRIEDGPHKGAPYLVMELLDGEPLDALLRRTGRLPAGTALRILGEVARGLSVAHKQGVVHRDLKPANVFLHRGLDGFVVPKILDFGISKLMAPAEGFDAQETTIGTILGSPAYMSPEQTAAEDLDPRADVWSLGVVLYKALSGELPFVAANFTTLMLAINTQEPRPLEERVPGLPRALYSLVHQCLSRRRNDRYASAGALADAIDKVLDTHDLPVLELSQVVGVGDAIAPLPSEHMKTREIGGSTLPFGVTSKSRQLADRSTTVQEATREVREEPVEPRDDEPQIVEAVAPQTSTVKRRSPAAIAVVAIVGVLGLGVFALRDRSGAQTAPAAAASSPKPRELASPVAPVASIAASTAPSASITQTPIEAAPIPAAKSGKKSAPAKTSQKPHAEPGPHEGLVHPGF